METKKAIKKSDILFTGFALFASYFGAGNLIFPPLLGLLSGEKWTAGMIGMIISGVGLPILAMIVLGIRGNVQHISDHVHKKFYTVFIGLIMILCCCVSIPRTAAVGIEMGVQGIFKSAPYIPIVIIYFIIAFFFAKDKGTALDKVGKILTPLMVAILFVLIIIGFVRPIGEPGPQGVDNTFLNSFLGAYSTGDVLVSFLLANLFLGSIKEKGYDEEAVKKVNLGACIIAAICLGFVYGGLFFMGACVSKEYGADIAKADLLLAVIRKSGGTVAIFGLCISVILACLTTAISQITSVATFFDEETHSKLPFKYLVIAVPIITTLVATIGLDKIVQYTSPWFDFTYPIALVLMLLGIFEKFIPNDGAYKGATYATVAFAVLNVPASYGVHIGFLDKILSVIPLYSMGLGWIVPAIAGLIVGLILHAALNKKETA